MKTLIIIPARGGSKGLPGKNIKVLNGKPLIGHTIDVAKSISSDEHICLSTDNDEIIDVAKDMGLEVPFKRPAELATDTAGSWEVILHALNFYKSKDLEYDVVILLQPTSPLRKPDHIREALDLYSPAVDMVVSVKETDANPYSILYEDNEDGFIEKSKDIGRIERRQDVPKVWEINGAIYVINVQSFYKYSGFSDFSKLKKYQMDKRYSVDIDDLMDFRYCEFLMRENLEE